MTFLPIVERELRVAARKRGTFGLRVQIAGMATLLSAVCFACCVIAPAFPFSKFMFWGLSAVCMVYCLSAGRLLTADSLSVEKREGTFGLLFLTDLKGYDVVLGKMAATALDGFYGLLAAFPLLAIPLLTGGMTNGEFWRMTLTLMNAFLFSAAVGILASSIGREVQKTMGINFGLLLLLAGFLPACAGLLIAAEPKLPLPHEMFYSCPVYALWQCDDKQYGIAPGHFWWSIGVTFCLTLALVTLACRVAPRSWQDQPVKQSARKQAGERRRRWWREGGAAKAGAFRKTLLDANAYFWLAARPYLKVSYVWTFLALMGCWWIATTLSVQNVREEANFTMGFLINLTLKLWIASEAGHQLAADKKSGAFELLLTTPLNGRDILRGQWQALRRQFLKPLIVTVALELVLMVSVTHWQQNLPNRCVWLAGIVMLLADVAALGWLGMSWALTAKSHGRALIKTVVAIMALPWGLFLLVEGLTHLWIFLFSRNQWDPGWDYDLAWWVGLGLAVDAVFFFRARRRLLASFHELGLESVPSETRFAKLLGWRDPAGKTSAAPGRLRWAAVTMALLLTVGIVAGYYVIQSMRTEMPKPVVVQVGRSNGPTRIFAGQGGFLFLMPDRTLWEWGPRGGASPPRQIGASHDWVRASIRRPNATGVRADGTLWQWDLGGEPKQVGTNSDWVEACSIGDSLIGLRRDGTAWMIDRPAKAQKGAKFMDGKFLQIGTNQVWKAISTTAGAAQFLGLRNDGTLWSWGWFNYFRKGMWAQTNYDFPVQVCRESNWAGFNDGAFGGVRDGAGESWNFFPFNGLGGPDVPAAALGSRMTTNTAKTCFGLLYATDHWTEASYEMRLDGTLWAAANTWPPIFPPGSPLQRVGERSDWSSVCGNFYTMAGSTADGTLWAWGLDYGQASSQHLAERLGRLKEMIAEALGSRPLPNFFEGMEEYQPQKEPRVLMRIVVTNGPP